MFVIASQHCLLALLAPQQPRADHALSKASSVMLHHACPGSAGELAWKVCKGSAVKVQAADSLRQHGSLLEGRHSQGLN